MEHPVGITADSNGTIPLVAQYYNLLDSSLHEERVEKTGPDADASEIAEWLEADFVDAVADGVDEAVKDRDEEGTT